MFSQGEYITNKKDILLNKYNHSYKLLVQFNKIAKSIVITVLHDGFIE